MDDIVTVVDGPEITSNFKAWQAKCFSCPLQECNYVPPTGPKSSLMLVGEAPGFDEVEGQEPFIGKAGGYLDEALEAVDMPRELIRITNSCLCHPVKNNGKSNRTPTEEEIICCNDRLFWEIEQVDPKVIVAMGNTALRAVLGEYIPINQMDEVLVILKGRIVVPTLHPATCAYGGKEEKLGKIIKDLHIALKEL